MSSSYFDTIFCLVLPGEGEIRMIFTRWQSFFVHIPFEKHDVGGYTVCFSGIDGKLKE